MISKYFPAAERMRSGPTMMCASIAPRSSSGSSSNKLAASSGSMRISTLPAHMGGMHEPCSTRDASEPVSERA
eukprot:775818-Pyramimonas_sp.AAC.1